MRYIISAQAGALSLALAEAGGPRIIQRLEPGVVLCDGAVKPERPVFLRHMCPAEIEVPLCGGMEDLDALCGAIIPLLERLDTLKGFSVQTRILEGYKPGYKRFDVNTVLSGLACESGAVLDVKAPAQVVSVVLSSGMGWIGLSNTIDNISAWAGGARRFKWEEAQISRAEFKLLEALEWFDIPLRDGDTALDLGAAPGGWTRILRSRGLSVTAVDPAELDARVARDKRVTHVKETAQAYFRAPAPCDIMVNDMKMDADRSAALMAEGAHCLNIGGCAIMTLKLPEDTAGWPSQIRRAEAELRGAYRVEAMRQLFHNRNEVTAYLTRL